MYLLYYHFNMVPCYFTFPRGWFVKSIETVGQDELKKDLYFQ